MPQININKIATGLNNVAIGSVQDTGESGFLMRVINETGNNSIKGMVVAYHSGGNKRVKKADDTTMHCGVVAEGDISNGDLMWIWLSGSICQILMIDGKTSVIGDIVMSDGASPFLITPGSNKFSDPKDKLTSIGFALEDIYASGDTLVLCHLQLN